MRARQVVNTIYVDDKIKDYIVDIVLATRDPSRYGARSQRLHPDTALRRAPPST